MTTSNLFPILLNVDLTETDATVEIEADISGFSPENVKVATTNNSLIIETTCVHETGQSYYLGELDPQDYRRIISLGFPAREEDLKVRFSHGTLRIGVPKPENAKSGLTGSPAQRAAPASA